MNKIDASSRPTHWVDVLSTLAVVAKRVVRLLVTAPPVSKGLSWRRIAYTVAVAAGFALWGALGGGILRMSGWYGSRVGPVGFADFLTNQSWGFLFQFREYLLLFFSQMLALTLADNLRIPHVPRTVLLVTALLIGTTVGSTVVMTTGHYENLPAATGLTWGGLIALVYFNRRRDEELAAALHAAQLAQVELKRKALESKLQLMQAQVEPEFLFNTLKRVGDLYENNPSSADRMLDNLIVYLRAVLPQMRTSSSTLGREVQLARAYLEIERIRLNDRLDFAFNVPQELGFAAFPPMMLLPLIEAVAMRAREGSDYEGALRMEACAKERTLAITLAQTGSARPAADAIENIRGRLAALYGTDAKLEVESLRPRGAIATLDVPYVAT